MGTSYYLYLKSDYEIIRNYFKTRNNNNLFNIGEYDLLSSIRINIGKSSSGWKFCLHIYPNHNINSFKDWHDILKNDEYIIVDEYNNVISLNEMINIITKKPGVYKKEDAGKIIDNQYIVSEVGLLQHSYKGFIVVENETYDYLICDYGLFDYWGNIDEF